MKQLFIFAFIIASSTVNAQQKPSEKYIGETEKRISAVIAQLFDGMRTSDSTKVHAAFSDAVNMRSTFTDKKSGNQVIHTGSLSEFLSAVGTPKEELWDERISNVQIHIDDNLAQVWMDYSFYINEKFSHCGVNSIQLIRIDDQWKITDIADTRRKTNCAE